jgi:DNA polymerase-3 subunit epsilon/ATP-dependent DNA helicase DinG
MRRHGPENADELRILSKILVWLQNSETGDRGEINLNGPTEREVWSRLSAEDEGCSTENCIKRGGICPFYRARMAAQSAHILIVNHALLLADVATGNRVLPEYRYLIVDEAHHLEDATTNALSFRATQTEIDRTLHHLGSDKSGTLGSVLVAMEGILSPTDFASIKNLVQQATNYAFNFQNIMHQFFDAINQYLFEQREGQSIGTYTHQERILPASRAQPAWADVEVTWDEASRSLKPLLDIIAKIHQALDSKPQIR